MIKSKKVDLEGFEYILNFPTQGQLIDIESLKWAYSNNCYAVWANAGLKSTEYALDSVDAISFLQTLIPTLKSDLSIKQWSDVDPMLMKRLIRIYKKDIKPWLSQLLIELYKADEEDEEPKDQA